MLQIKVDKKVINLIFKRIANYIIELRINVLKILRVMWYNLLTKQPVTKITQN